jgi:hypothetical protein
VSAAITFWTGQSSKLSSGELLQGLVFSLPIAALVLAFVISMHSGDGIVAQTVEQVASYQM